MFVAPSDHTGLDSVSQSSILRNFLRELTTLEECDVFVQTEGQHENWVRECLPENHTFHIRTDGPTGRAGLPRKVQAIVRDRFEDGYDRVLSVAADTPGLDEERIQKAIEFLRTEKPAAIVGPSRDGGFYLLGVNTHRSNLFDGVPFYVENTFRCLMDQLKILYDQIQTLERLRDVDRPTDWFSVDRRWLQPYRWILKLVRRVAWFGVGQPSRPTNSEWRTPYLARSYRSPPLSS